MLGKLLKHEFRATGRIMLPMMGALAVLSLLANLSIRGLAGNTSDLPGLRLLFVLILTFYGISIVAICVMAMVIMVSRFYRNLLKDEGYLMFTLPVSVHELIWSKLIVSLVWFLATGLLILAVLAFNAFNLSGTNLQMIFSEFPSWAEIRQKLDAMGIRGELFGFVGWVAAATLLQSIVGCLHFYGAMSLGHMFTKNKVMLSVVFFILISFAFNIMDMGYGSVAFHMDLEAVDMDTAREGLRFVSTIARSACLIQLVQGAVLYLATALGLKRGLNLE